MHSLTTGSILILAFLVTLPLLCDGSSNVTLENLNALVISNMQHQMKTMEESLKLVQMSCGRQRVARPLPKYRDAVIAFHAKLDKSIQNLPHDAKLVFDNVTLNEGSAYNGKTGIFTCPGDGVYVFEWAILSSAGKFFYLEFMINGKRAAKTRNDQPSNKINSVSGSVVVKIKKGDQAWLESLDQYVGQYAYRHWTYFSGFKL